MMFCFMVAIGLHDLAGGYCITQWTPRCAVANPLCMPLTCSVECEMPLEKARSK